MKQKRLLFVAIGIMAVVLANAATWRINPNPAAKAQYKTVAEAMDDVHVRAGDTLLLDPGFHGDISLSKERITVIGTGYFLDQNKGWNENDQTFIGTAYISGAGTIEGCVANTIYPGTNSTVRRCKAKDIPYYRWFEDGDNANFIVEQCYVTGEIAAKSYSIIRNNLIFGKISYGGNGATIENNTVIMDSPYEIYRLPLTVSNVSHGTIRNNIFINTNQELNEDLIPASSGWVYYKDLEGWSMTNNITSIAPEYKDKKFNNHDIGVTVESLFLNEGSDDGKWQLSPNSPAKGAATDGGDCGAFGGKNPYVLSGLPQFTPHITKIEVPSRPTDGKLTIKLQIENQNE